MVARSVKRWVAHWVARLVPGRADQTVADWVEQTASCLVARLEWNLVDPMAMHLAE